MAAPRIPFPIQSSDDEIRHPEQDGDLWAQGVELMETFAGETGGFKHWDSRLMIWIMKNVKGS